MKRHYLIPATALGALGALLTGASALSATPADTVQVISHARSACTTSEKWVYGGAIRKAFRESMDDSLNGRIAPVRGFSEALAMRRFAQTAEAKVLGEYWISRSLADSKLKHIAWNGFISILSRPVTEETAGVQLAALNCLTELQIKTPALQLPEVVTAKLPDLMKNAVVLDGAREKNLKEVVWRASFNHLSASLGSRKPAKKNKAETSEKIAGLFELLKDGGAYEQLAQGMRSAYDSDHGAAIKHLNAFLANTSAPAHLKKYTDTVHLLLARSLYALQQYDRAVLQVKAIPKSSNELAESLSELAWIYLMDDKLTDAIGSAVSLQVGGMRHTYAPEAPMVMAMALNELCQYPESVRAIRTFKKNYEKAYQWLQKGGVGDNPYAIAAQYVRKIKSDAPDRVVSDWIRSPLFISSQDEINSLFEENDSSLKLGRSGATEQKKLADELIKNAQGLSTRLKLAKAKLGPDDSLPGKLLDDLAVLRDSILKFRRLQQGAPVWHTILATHQKNAPKIKERLVATINRDLKERSGRMAVQLEEIAENIQMIEVEIYNGASQDIIWQNAHPEYKKMADSLKSDTVQVQASKTWDWGRVPAGEEEGEVWEDELGSFNANLVDNCSSKDKFLALKMGRR